MLDPKRRWRFAVEQVRSKSKNSPFLGRELMGLATHVLVAGRRVVRDGKLAAEQTEQQDIRG